MTREQCAAIAAYLSASISEAHVARDLSETIELSPDPEHVDQANQDLCAAAEHLEHCFQALPGELREYLEEQAMPDLPEFPATPAPMPPGMDVDCWAEMDPRERWEFVYWNFPDMCPDSVTR